MREANHPELLATDLATVARARSRMPKSRIKLEDLHEVDFAAGLDSEEEIATYLAEIRKENNPELLACAMADVERARAKMADGIPSKRSRKSSLSAKNQ